MGVLVQAHLRVSDRDEGGGGEGELHICCWQKDNEKELDKLENCGDEKTLNNHNGFIKLVASEFILGG